MNIRFWGVRGSQPAPLTPQQVQSKIIAAVQRIRPSDLESAETRAKFLASLPPWIFGTTGGNTPCVELSSGQTEIILDAGTGLRLLGKSPVFRTARRFSILFSHFHWDHIQGIPFFDPLYNPSSEAEIYSHSADTEKFLTEQMSQPYFPVPFGSFTKKIKFITLNEGHSFFIDGIKVTSCRMFHPGGSYSYSFEENGRKFVYATDVELKADSFTPSPERTAVFGGADCIVLDSQYTVEESYGKENWGHSAFCYAVDFAVHWNIKKLYLFHHEPVYDDKKLNSILQAARWYARYINHSDIEIHLAREEDEIIL